uniref:Uncharacterized protein n=1 Tax=Arion vulgaris TaxID=1028688 RepID=A0A0B7BRJ0_9EUPU
MKYMKLKEVYQRYLTKYIREQIDMRYTNVFSSCDCYQDDYTIRCAVIMK